MTPVQLPEVPAREVVAHHIHGTEAEVLAFRLDMRNLLPGDLIGQSVHVLTADQLRAYATEAVMAERVRIAAGLDSAIRESVFSNFDRVRNDQWAVVTGPSTIVMSVHSAVLAILYTQPEQNSGR